MAKFGSNYRISVHFNAKRRISSDVDLLTIRFWKRFCYYSDKQPFDTLNEYRRGSDWRIDTDF